MYYDSGTKQLVVSEDMKINIDTLVPDNATLEKVVFDENDEENLKLYVRLMVSIESIKVNYKVV